MKERLLLREFLLIGGGSAGLVQNARRFGDFTKLKTAHCGWSSFLGAAVFHWPRKRGGR